LRRYLRLPVFETLAKFKVQTWEEGKVKLKKFVLIVQVLAQSHRLFGFPHRTDLQYHAN
jgi:hypothetical protein